MIDSFRALRLTSFFAAALACATASAAALPTIKAADDGVQVGKEGSWKKAEAGTQVAATDFVKIPLNKKATITLPDSTTKEFPGRAIIPGRWLASDKDASGSMIWFSQGVQKAAGALVGEGGNKTHGNGGGKADDPEALRRKKALAVLRMIGENDKPDYGLDLDLAEDGMRRGEEGEGSTDEKIQKEATDAAATAKNIIDIVASRKGVPPADRRRARYLQGVLASSDGDFPKAIDRFTDACQDLAKGEDELKSETIRRRAFLQRAEIYNRTGDDVKEAADLAIAADAKESATSERAKFLLGILAFSKKDAPGAKKWFETIKDSNPDLYAEGQKLLKQ